MEVLGLIWELCLRWGFLRVREGGGIFSVEVKFVDIGKNIGGEGGYLVCI